MTDRIVLHGLFTGHNDGHWCIDLSETAHKPVLPRFRILSRDSYFREEGCTDIDLSLSIGPLVTVIHPDFSINVSPGQHPFSIPFANFLQWLASHNMENQG